LEGKQRPIILVGPARSGKHTLINILCKEVLKKKVFFFNPEAMGTFRELYGCEDPVS
jgi:predicted AAA+ superfamily ATPase